MYASGLILKRLLCAAESESKVGSSDSSSDMQWQVERRDEQCLRMHGVPPVLQGSECPSRQLQTALEGYSFEGVLLCPCSVDR